MPEDGEELRNLGTGRQKSPFGTVGQKSEKCESLRLGKDSCSASSPHNSGLETQGHENGALGSRLVRNAQNEGFDSKGFASLER